MVALAALDAPDHASSRSDQAEPGRSHGSPEKGDVGGVFRDDPVLQGRSVLDVALGLGDRADLVVLFQVPGYDLGMGVDAWVVRPAPSPDRRLHHPYIRL